MKDYAILMDVSGDVDRSYVEQGKVTLLPMEFIINGEAYLYTDDESGMTTKQFYDFVRAKAPMSTAKITPMKWMEFFEPYAKQGISVICSVLSSGLTNAIDGAREVAEELMGKYPGVEIYPIDSLGATGVEGLICERMISNKEKGLSAKENFEDVSAYTHRLRATAYVDDLDALKRGGRISRTVAFVGGLLGIKPLIQFDKEGTLSVWGKQRGYKPSINKVVEYYLENADLDNPQTVYITHADEESYANELADKIRAANPLCTIKIRVLSPIIGVHLGPGAMVLSFVGK